jgi:hypothetical protein
MQKEVCALCKARTNRSYLHRFLEHAKVAFKFPVKLVALQKRA